MNSKTMIFSLLLAMLFMIGCAPKSVSYDLPSVETVEQPEWVQDAAGERDSVFLVIKVALTEDAEMAKAIQIAQSELSELLRVEIEGLLLEFFEQSADAYPQEVVFKRLSVLPETLEAVMTYVAVEDAWESSGEVAVLCGFDHTDVGALIMKDMRIKDRGFLSSFKDHMDAIANKHQ